MNENIMSRPGKFGVLLLAALGSWAVLIGTGGFLLGAW